MVVGISTMAKQELLASIRDRYHASSKKDTSLIFNELIAVTVHRCEHGIQLLAQSGKGDYQVGEGGGGSGAKASRYAQVHRADCGPLPATRDPSIKVYVSVANSAER